MLYEKYYPFNFSRKFTSCRIFLLLLLTGITIAGSVNAQNAQIPGDTRDPNDYSFKIVATRADNAIAAVYDDPPSGFNCNNRFL